MISRKERRIQKALGVEDGIPLAIHKRIYKRIQLWWWANIWYTYKHKWTMNVFWQWLAFKLPKRLVAHYTIRVWAHATQCPSGCGEVVGVTTVENAIKRWENE